MLSAEQAVAILQNLCRVLGEGPPSSPGINQALRPAAAATETWWLDGDRRDDPYANPRTQAYLRAYLAIAGDELPARGIPLSDRRYMWLDKGIMKSLLLFNLIASQSGTFRLTDAGREYLRRGVSA